MTPAAQRYLAMNKEQQKYVHIFLCEKSLEFWESFIDKRHPMNYQESACGTMQAVDVQLPREALASVKAGRDLAHVKDAYVEPLVAHQDGDLVLPDNAYYAYFAIYHAFALQVIGKEIDGGLIVRQALSCLDENSVNSILQQAVASVA